MRARCVGRVPLECVELRPVVDGGEVGMVEQDVVVELAPAKLAQELRDVPLRGGGHIAVHAMPDLERAELAEREAGAEPAGDVPGREVAGVVVLRGPLRRTLRAVRGQQLRRASTPLAARPPSPDARAAAPSRRALSDPGSRNRIPDGAGTGSRTSSSRRGRQNGVKTLNGSPCPVRTAHGSKSRLAWKLRRRQRLLERRIHLLGARRSADSRTPRSAPTSATNAGSTSTRGAGAQRQQAARARAASGAATSGSPRPSGRTPAD